MNKKFIPKNLSKLSEIKNYSKKIKTMEDTDLMPFGIHIGKQMANVPAHYLIWLYENKKCGEPVKQYIKDNLEVLKTEMKKK